MTEIATTFETPDSGPSATAVTATSAEGQALITEQQVLFSTAAAVALPPDEDPSLQRRGPRGRGLAGERSEAACATGLPQAARLAGELADDARDGQAVISSQAARA